MGEAMANYKRMLLAVDLRVKHDVTTIAQAAKMAKAFNATLNVIHVMEPIYSYGGSPGSAFVEMEKRIADDARKAFEALATGTELSLDQFILETGSPIATVVDVAEKLKVDLIMVGAHHKHGIQKLLGSTANGIINLALCDVLTIRTKD